MREFGGFSGGNVPSMGNREQSVPRGIPGNERPKQGPFPNRIPEGRFGGPRVPMQGGGRLNNPNMGTGPGMQGNPMMQRPPMFGQGMGMASNAMQGNPMFGQGSMQNVASPFQQNGTLMNLFRRHPGIRF